MSLWALHQSQFILRSAEISRWMFCDSVLLSVTTQTETREIVSQVELMFLTNILQTEWHAWTMKKISPAWVDKFKPGLGTFAIGHVVGICSSHPITKHNMFLIYGQYFYKYVGLLRRNKMSFVKKEVAAVE